MLARVIQWSLDHRTVVLLAWAGIAVMGVVAFLRLPLDAFRIPPLCRSGQYRGSALSPGAERQVTAPLGQAISGLPS
jgi:cobalt-zinc-cadmium resistance protein CzcA